MNPVYLPWILGCTAAILTALIVRRLKDLNSSESLFKAIAFGAMWSIFGSMSGLTVFSMAQQLPEYRFIAQLPESTLPILFSIIMTLAMVVPAGRLEDDE